MTDLKIVFSNPWLLFALIPALLLIFIPFFRIPKKFRGTRNRVISVTLHSLAAVLLVLLLAGMTLAFSVPNRENELLIVVDMSDSGSEQKDTRDEYIQTLINMSDDNYKVGIVTFGYDAVYAAPLAYGGQGTFRQYLAAEKPDTSATNIAGALEFAAEQFSYPQTAKIVLLSDGFETDEDALSAAQLIASQGIRIDTVHFADEEHGEIQLIDVETPTDKVILNSQVKLLVTVESSIESEVSAAITLTDNDFEDEPVSVTIVQGVQTIEIPHIFTASGMHDLRFNIECSEDFLTENNIFQAELNINVFENILILENVRGESSALQDILASYYMPTVCNIHDDADLIPKTAKELCAYEQVILVNISNADLTSPSMPQDFDRALYDYVYNFGGSLLTIGGENDVVNGEKVPHAYNRTDMAGSLFQEMLPVQAIDYTPPVAVMIVIDSSGSMSMGKYQAALNGARETLSVLNDRDYCGVMSFSSSASEEVAVLPVSQRDKILSAIDHLGDSGGSGGSGGTVFSGAIQRAGRALAPISGVDRKHIILITDGNPSDHLEQTSGSDNNFYGGYIDQNVEDGITMSVITVGMSGSAEQMLATAERGQGNYYNVPSTAPDGTVSAYMRQDLAEVTLSEMEEGVEIQPTVNEFTSIFTGVDQSMIPALTGYYGTKAKEEASVPLIYQYVPIYAAWQFGEGKVGSFMSALNEQWAAEFIAEENAQLLIRNIAESLAPLQPPEPDRLDFVIRTDTKNYDTRLDVFTDLAEGEFLQVTVTPLSNDAYNYYGGDVPVFAVGNNVSFDFSILYTGVYEIKIEKFAGADAQAPLSDIVLYQTFSYSDEYDVIREEDGSAEFLASLAAGGGGAVIEDPVQVFSSFTETLAKTWDPTLTFLIIAAVCILIDIAVRKFKFKWLHEIIRDRRAMKELNDSKEAKIH